MSYTNVTPPAGGKITFAGGRLQVPDNPVLPFIEGDGTGPDIWRAAVRVFDAAVDRAYQGRRRISCCRRTPCRRSANTASASRAR